MAGENIHTINLGKVTLSQSQHRAVRAINMIREYVQKHKNTPNVKIDQELAHMIWSRGVRRPPRKVTVELIDDGGEVLVVPYSESVIEEAPPLKEDAAKEIETDETDETAIEDTSTAVPTGALPGEVSDSVPEPRQSQEPQDPASEQVKTGEADQEESPEPTKREQ